MMKNYLTENDIEKIKNHKYNTTGYSWLDYKFNPFWELCAKNTPYIITPNMLTILGVVFLFSGVFIAYFADNTMSKDISNWLRIWYAFAVFMGQTLDAIDGKHARNTKRCSPLGQLMDHSMDCFSNSFFLIMVASCFNFGSSFNTLFLLFHFQISYWVVNWEEHHTGVFRTHVDNIGNTELQLCGIACLLFPIIDYFNILRIPFLFNFNLLDFLVYFNVILGEISFNFKIFYFVMKKIDNSERKSALMNIISIVMFISSEMLLLNSEIFKNHTIEVIFIYAMVFGFYSSKMIISTMTKTALPLVDTEILLFFIFQLINVFFLYQYYKVQLIAYIIFGSYILFKYYGYLISIIIQLLIALNLSF